MADPIGAAPAEIRHDVWRVWVCFQHLLPSPLSIAGMVRVWVDLHGLTHADARTILYSLLAPSAAGSFKFASDLMSHLAAKVAERLEQLAKAEALERRRKEEAERDAAVPPKERGSLVKMFEERAGEIGTMPAADRSPASPKHNEAFLEAASERSKGGK